MSKKPDDQYSPKGLKEHDGRALEWCAPRWACAHEKQGRPRLKSKRRSGRLGLDNPVPNFRADVGPARIRSDQIRSDQVDSGSCFKTRCTTLVPIPSSRPILSIPSPLPLNFSICASIAGATRRRPSFVPFALARARPALTLSRIIPRSNSANR